MSVGIFATALLATTLVCEAASLWLWSGTELRLGAPPVVQGVLLAVLGGLAAETRLGRWAGAGIAIGWLTLGVLLDLGLLMEWGILVNFPGYALVPLMLPWVLLVGPACADPPYLTASGVALLTTLAFLTRQERPIARVAFLVAAAPLLVRALEFAKWVDETA